MQVQCPECGHRMTVEDLIEPGKTSTCSECGASFETGAHLLNDAYRPMDQEGYVVEWQISG
jgi:transcription elongation factor Elf1